MGGKKPCNSHLQLNKKDDKKRVFPFTMLKKYYLDELENEHAPIDFGKCN